MDFMNLRVSIENFKSFLRIFFPCTVPFDKLSLYIKDEINFLIDEIVIDLSEVLQMVFI